MTKVDEVSKKANNMLKASEGYLEQAKKLNAKSSEKVETQNTGDKLGYGGFAQEVRRKAERQEQEAKEKLNPITFKNNTKPAPEIPGGFLTKATKLDEAWFKTNIFVDKEPPTLEAKKKKLNELKELKRGDIDDAIRIAFVNTMADSFESTKNSGENAREEKLSKIASPLGATKEDIGIILSDLKKVEKESKQTPLKNFIDKIGDYFSKLFYKEQSVNIAVTAGIDVSNKTIKRTFAQKIKEQQDGEKNTGNTL